MTEKRSLLQQQQVSCKNAPRTCPQSPRFPPTFQEGIGSHGEEGQLEKGFAVDERLEPLGGLQHHGVPEGSCILLQQVCQLKKNQNSQSLSIHHSRAKPVILNGMKPPGFVPLVLSGAGGSSPGLPQGSSSAPGFGLTQLQLVSLTEM